MKVLLTTINSKYIHQNLAIRLLYELNRDFEGLSWKEFYIKQGIDEIAGYCAGYDLVAFSCYIWNISKTINCARKIKELNPGCNILLGGPEVSFENEDLIDKPEIDFIITGEGEIPFSSMLKSFPFVENVPSLIWKRGQQIIKNSDGQTFDVHLLTGINPYLNDDKEELKNKISYIESSRGCPHCCDFCLAGLENKVRYLPLDFIHSNLLYLMQNGKIIKFLDRTFNANPRFAISIFKYILDNYEAGNIFQFEIKADIYQAELVEFIQKNIPKGIFRFEIGIQTLNEKSNDAINRRQNFENTRKFIEQVSDLVEIHLDLIVGLPFDYYNDIKYSFEQVFKLFAPELQLGFLKFLKGTPIRINSEKHDYQYDTQPPYQIIKSKYLSAEQLDEITIVEHALEIYWNKKRAVNTLKYIALNDSIFDFLLGLGKYFKSKNSFHRYDLSDVYNNISEFSAINNPDDKIIQELITLDYYLQYKVKPKVRFLSEIDKVLKKEIFGKYQLNHHKYRYIIHPVHFNIQKFLTQQIVETTDDLLIVQYNGVDKAHLVLTFGKF